MWMLVGYGINRHARRQAKPNARLSSASSGSKQATGSIASILRQPTKQTKVGVLWCVVRPVSPRPKPARRLLRLQVADSTAAAQGQLWYVSVGSQQARPTHVKQASWHTRNDSYCVKGRMLALRSGEQQSPRANSHTHTHTNTRHARTQAVLTHTSALLPMHPPHHPRMHRQATPRQPASGSPLSRSPDG